MNQRNKDKRLKGFGIPIEVCVKYERMAGVKTGETPTKRQAEDVTRYMVAALTIGAANVVLSARDYELIAEEARANEQK